MIPVSVDLNRLPTGAWINSGLLSFILILKDKKKGGGDKPSPNFFLGFFVVVVDAVKNDELRGIILIRL